MKKLPIIQISGFDPTTNLAFCYEVDTAEDIRFTSGGFVEFDTETECYQMPVEYIDRIAVLH